MEKKIRLDLYLAKHNNISRNAAQNLILQSKVEVNNTVVTKTSFMVDESIDKVNITDNDEYVSRGAYKLLAAIENFNFNVNNLVCLDIGCSTGGFSQVLLEKGARKVYCLDVGENQLSPILANDQRVVKLIPLNLKDLNSNHFSDIISLVVCDVSFISLKHVFAKLNEIFTLRYEVIVLIKPQFELGKTIIDKCNGIVKDEALQKKAIEMVKEYAKSYGFHFVDLCKSPIKGAKGGNQEYLAWFSK